MVKIQNTKVRCCGHWIPLRNAFIPSSLFILLDLETFPRPRCYPTWSEYWVVCVLLEIIPQAESIVEICEYCAADNETEYRAPLGHTEHILPVRAIPRSFICLSGEESQTHVLTGQLKPTILHAWRFHPTGT